MSFRCRADFRAPSSDWSASRRTARRRAEHALISSRQIRRCLPFREALPRAEKWPHQIFLPPASKIPAQAFAITFIASRSHRVDDADRYRRFIAPSAHGARRFFGIDFKIRYSQGCQTAYDYFRFYLRRAGARQGMAALARVISRDDLLLTARHTPAPRAIRLSPSLISGTPSADARNDAITLRARPSRRSKRAQTSGHDIFPGAAPHTTLRPRIAPTIFEISFVMRTFGRRYAGARSRAARRHAASMMSSIDMPRQPARLLRLGLGLVMIVIFSRR